MQVVTATRFGDPGVLMAIEAPEPVAGPEQAVIESRDVIGKTLLLT